jgi:serine/threonine-protein kinase
LNPAIPAELEQVLLKVLSKEPSARYRTADQFGRVLMTIQNQLENPIQSVPLPDYPVTPELPSTRPAKSPTKPAYVRPAPPAQSPLEIDWITIGLGLLAVVAVGGLLPFFLWIYFMYNPPVP